MYAKSIFQLLITHDPVVIHSGVSTINAMTRQSILITAVPHLIRAVSQPVQAASIGLQCAHRNQSTLYHNYISGQGKIGFEEQINV